MEQSIFQHGVLHDNTVYYLPTYRNKRTKKKPFFRSSFLNLGVNKIGDDQVTRPPRSLLSLLARVLRKIVMVNDNDAATNGDSKKKSIVLSRIISFRRQNSIENCLRIIKRRHKR